MFHFLPPFLGCQKRKRVALVRAIMGRGTEKNLPPRVHNKAITQLGTNTHELTWLVKKKTVCSSNKCKTQYTIIINTILSCRSLLPQPCHQMSFYWRFCCCSVTAFVWDLQGIARTQSPSPKNYALESPAFEAIAGVSPPGVQWTGLALGEPPCWSGYLPCQVSMLTQCIRGNPAQLGILKSSPVHSDSQINSPKINEKWKRYPFLF